MVTTGIIGAKDIEVRSIIGSLTDRAERQISGITFMTGRIYGHDVVLAGSGVGKVSAAICAQIMISVFGVGRIINTGIAGSLSDSLRQCDIVVASAFVEHDMDTTQFGDAPGYLSGLDIVTLPCDEDFAALIYDAAADIGCSVGRGLIATGDQFIADKARADYIRSTFGAVACEMEGGAIAHACYMGNIPFAGVRCISDNADGDAFLSYSEFISAAAERCAQLVLETFRRLEE